ncbi:MAG: S8 family serine peptidase [Bdellovibrionaceae bacterium]|nr:S8 family serine peptidase [Pseudobdellovibrionaceae bacterium]
MNFRLFLTAPVVTGLVIGLAACQRPQMGLTETGGLHIFSDRPSEIERYVVVVRLKTPPLAATADVSKGQLVIDAEQAEILKAEQEDFIKEATAISSEIKVVFTYSMVLNAVAIDLPWKYRDQIKGLSQVLTMDSAGTILRPSVPYQSAPTDQAVSPLKERNSVKFIGAEKLHSREIKDASGKDVKLDGTGMKIGVIDSGIDYTHAMFGGPGTVEAYQAIDPKTPSALFPNSRVKGGYDFAGSNFDPRSPNLALHIPEPDANPLDEGSHGSHVAGTIGGIGDGVTSYNGVAPGAELYALKVFAKGPTSDTLVLAAMDFAMDPDRDGNPSDRLDVLNLSLGHAFGSNGGLYAEAIRNLARAGIVTVASAGNEGDFAYITGAPGAVTEALSVAASIDDAFHNTQFPTVAIASPSLGRLVVSRVEGPISKEIGSIVVPMDGKLVDVGLADKPMTEEQAAALKGNVALIARGGVAFKQKLDNVVAAGAVGALVTNNNDEPAFVMGGDGSVDIPAVMIDKATGDKVRAAMATEEVRIEFTAKDVIEKPELIDSIVGFSSAGPRSVDSIIKPEITSPGAAIVSAAAGKGKEVAKMSGTSMAGPHIAGAIALLKQAHPDLSAYELKNLLMGRTVRLKTADGAGRVTVARQGAGRVQVDRAVESPIVADRPSFSLGRQQVQGRKGLLESINFKSISQEDADYTVVLESRHKGLTLKTPASFTLAAGETAAVNLNFQIDASKMENDAEIMDGWVIVKNGDEEVYHVPVLAVVRQISNIQLDSIKIQSTSIEDAAGAATEVKLNNVGSNKGDVMLFNLIDVDARKPNPTGDDLAHNVCDMQAVGYRIVNKDIEGVSTSMLQIAVKMYQPMTTFNYCEVSVLLDADGDGKEDQELAMITLKNVEGLSTPQNENTFASVLFDAKEMRRIRKAAEDEAKTSQKPQPLDYKAAVIDMLPHMPRNHSTVNWVEARIDKLMRSKTGDLSVKLASLQLDSSSDESDDFLGEGGKTWLKISLMPSSQSYMNLPEIFTIDAKGSKTLQIKKGEGRQPLMILAPQNPTLQSDVLKDGQMQLGEPTFDFE